MSETPLPAGDQTAHAVEAAQDPPAPSDSNSAPLSESTLARSVYLYVILLLSVLGMVIGGIVASQAVLHIVVPDTGHRDGLDRVTVGLAEVSQDGLDIAREFLTEGTPTLEVFCGSDMDPDCVDFYGERYGGQLDVVSSVEDIVTSIQDETRRQIRLSSIGWLFVGLVLLGSSLLSFRSHAQKSALYRS